MGKKKNGKNEVSLSKLPSRILLRLFVLLHRTGIRRLLWNEAKQTNFIVSSCSMSNSRTQTLWVSSALTSCIVNDFVLSTAAVSKAALTSWQAGLQWADYHQSANSLKWKLCTHSQLILASHRCYFWPHLLISLPTGRSAINTKLHARCVRGLRPFGAGTDGIKQLKVWKSIPAYLQQSPGQ